VGGAIVIGLLARQRRGAEGGAWASDVFSAAKLVPLALFVIGGLFMVEWSRLGAPPAPRLDSVDGTPETHRIVAGAVAGLFACTGFEFVSVPAGETRNPARAVPIALLAASAAR